MLHYCKTLIILSLLSSTSLCGQFWLESFTEASGIPDIGTSEIRVTSVAHSNRQTGTATDVCGNGNYFVRTSIAGSTTIGVDIGATNKTFTGQSGHYWRGEDTDNCKSDPDSIYWNDIDIEGQSSLVFSIKLAANNGTTWENHLGIGSLRSDYLKLEYRVDEVGDYTQLIIFRSDNSLHATKDGFGILKEDTDGDGIGDGIALDTAFQNYVFNLTATGESMEIRFIAYVDNGGEEFGLDDLSLSGITTCAKPPKANAGIDQNICIDAFATMTATVGGSATAGTWSGFAPGMMSSTTEEDAVFTPHASQGGTTVKLTWTSDNPDGGTCIAAVDFVDIVVSDLPTIASTGEDQNTVCLITFLEGNTPDVGTGVWSIISGSGGQIRDNNFPGSTFTGLSGQTYILRWTISNGACTPSFSEVSIQMDDSGTTLLWDDDFEDNTSDAGEPIPIRFAVNHSSPFSGTICRTGDYFVRTNQQSGNGFDVPFTGIDGTYYWRGEDVNNCNATPNAVIEFNDIDIEGHAGIIFKGLFAARASSTWEDNDFLKLEYRIDDGPYVNALCFAGNTSNGKFSLDTDCNGVGDGYSLTSLMTEFSFHVIGSGDSIDIRLSANSGVEEEFGFDNFRLIATTSCMTSNIAIAGSNQEVCGNMVTLAADAPLMGTTGTWSELIGDGNGVFDLENSPTTTFTGSLGIRYVLRWTIEGNAPCPSAMDDVEIILRQAPTTANAGNDQLDLECQHIFLSANDPLIGTGLWSLISALGGTIRLADNSNSPYIGLEGMTDTLVWTISNGACMMSSDTVIVSFIASSLMPLWDDRFEDDEPDMGDPSPIRSADNHTGLELDGEICNSGDYFVRTNDPGNGSTNGFSETFSNIEGSKYWRLEDIDNCITVMDSLVFRNINIKDKKDLTFKGLFAANANSNWEEEDFVKLMYRIKGGAYKDGICFVKSASNSFGLDANCDGIAEGFELDEILTEISFSIPELGDSLDLKLIAFVDNGGEEFAFDNFRILGKCNSPEISSVNATPSAYCISGTSTLNVIGDLRTATNWKWYQGSCGGSLIGTGSSISVSPSSSTTYYVRGEGGCIGTSDMCQSVTVTVDAAPTIALAGMDQTVCATMATLAGNAASIGTGEWKLISGSATITNSSSATSGLTGLGIGANKFEWSISNGVCMTSRDTVIITRDAIPTIASAGMDQTVCSRTVTLAGNTVSTGTGLWKLISGSATITTSSSATSGLTGLGVGANKFEWSISNGVCMTSRDTVIITRDATPTIASAGMDQVVCSTTSTLAGNAASTGTGIWNLISGSATITNSSSATSGLTGLGVGSNKLEWSISNGVCMTSRDTVIISRDAIPTTSLAGMDQTVCATTATLAGNAATIGTGIWKLISGSATITTSSSATSGLTDLGVGSNKLEWSIRNGVCMTSRDTVIITRDAMPTIASAGVDQTVCATTATLAGNAASIGTGEWKLLSGSATITNSSSATSGLTGLGVGSNKLEWSISNGVCMTSRDTVIITRDAVPTTSSAGMDQAVCTTTATLAGNAATIGTGIWKLISGSATITTSSSATSGLTDLGVGSNKLEWSIRNGVCMTSRDTVIITRDAMPTIASAGMDQTVCATTATLAGNAVITGTGIWKLISGSATITNPSSATSGLTGLGVGANKLEWSISNGVCMTSRDTVLITRDAVPTTSSAGMDQAVCATTATLAGNAAVTGTSIWKLISGSATITNSSSATSGLTGLGVGSNKLEWSISNGVCMTSRDTVIITRDAIPTTSLAGMDQTVCATTATLAGNAATIGTGIWKLISGSATITTSSSATSGLTDLGVGSNKLEWSIRNGVCMTSRDTVIITRDAMPTIASAGMDQTVCATTATLAGNAASIGTGEWKLLSGSATITNSSSATSGLTGLGVGSNKLEWSISNGVCMTSRDTVIITRDAIPTTSLAGMDQTVCATTATLAGNAATIGTGIWKLISGSATITTSSSATSGLTDLGVGSNKLEWSIRNGVCMTSRDTVIITRDAMPTIASAGMDQTVCATTATLAGNAVITGTGIWKLISGSATITNPSSATSGLTGLGVGANKLEWSISNGVCMTSRDTVLITRDAVPTTSSAGMDQAVCATTATLAGNAASTGTGLWKLISGTATITTSSSATSGLTGLGVGSNKFEWSIRNGVCMTSRDTVVITRDAMPTIASAGLDQTVCATTATLAGNAASIGTGEWKLISGSATITNSSSATSGLTGLGVGSNKLEWSISNGVCMTSRDTVVITRDAMPSTSSTGMDQTVCSTTATLAGNAAVIGTGEWKLLSGIATITNSSSSTSGLTGLGVGSNKLEWSISNGVCMTSRDTVIITRDAVPTTSSAGMDQTVCSTTATLAGNAASIGTGEWKLISGSATITNSSSDTSGLTGLGVGSNKLEWSISNGVCMTSRDTVVITRDAMPTIASAGMDQTVCATTAILAGNEASTGTGIWKLISGSATITTSSSATSGLTGLGVGANKLEWSISNGVCMTSRDTVTITRDAMPTIASAGMDQTVCATTAILAGNAASTGTGLWKLISGSATITNSSSATSGLTDLGVGTNKLEWSISNGVCMTSRDTVIITRDAEPTVSSAGMDQTVCSSTSNLAGNAAVTGTGIWKLISGSATITTSSSATSGLTGLGVGANKLEWSISNGVCITSRDTVIITRDAMPTTSSAGMDQTVCSSTNLSGNTATIGIGVWTLVSGMASITMTTSPTTFIEDLEVGTNKLEWSISNGVCEVSRDTVDIIVLPPLQQPSIILGPSSLCPSLDNIDYSIESVSNATSYSWTFDDGSVTLIENGTSIVLNVKEDFSGGMLSVVANGICESSESRTLDILLSSPSVCELATCLRENSFIDSGLLNALSNIDVFKASNRIETNALIKATRAITFKAGNEIAFYPPFEVAKGGKLVAEIEACVLSAFKQEEVIKE